MSALSEIYAALAAIPVSADGKTPTVYAYDALPSALTTAQLPCRLLQAPGTRLDAQAGRALALGGGQVLRWRLTDLLLWSPSGQGRRAEHGGALVAYCEAYAGAVGIGLALDTSASRATVVNVTFEPGLFEYPKPGGGTFHGVECAVWVEEIT